MYKKSITGGIILLFLLSSTIPFASSNEVSSNNIIYVDDDGGADYTRIQDAIDNASDGDTIYVYSGTYYETVRINKSIILIGEDNEFTIIDSKNMGTVIGISANNVNISGFTIRNATENNGVSLSSDNNIIRNNIILNSFGGVYSQNHFNNVIEENVIMFSGNVGVDLRDSYNCLINGNNIKYSHGQAIYFSGSSNNTICNNNIDTTGLIGIHIRWGSYNNTVCKNHIMNTKGQTGLVFSDINNYAYHNNFLNNPRNAKGRGCFWDNGYPSGGNYWDDYDGVDNYSGENQDIVGSDGIGDIPYNLDDNHGSDKYPLMTPYNFTDNVKPTISITKPVKSIYHNNSDIFPFFVSIIFGDVTIEVDAFDGYGVKNVSFYIDNELVKTDSKYGYSYKWKSEGFGIHKIKAIAYDFGGNYISDSITVIKIN